MPPADAKAESHPDNTGFSLFHCEAPQSPILLSVPHAGRDYSPALLEKARVRPAELVRLEDRYADRLAQQAIANGTSAIIARHPRAWLDLNRAEKDLDREMIRGVPAEAAYQPSAKTRGGLGLVPRRLSGCGELWKSMHDHAEIEQRLQSFYRPYHSHIDHILRQMRELFGFAILLDIHSMPPLHRQYGWNLAQWVIGDRFGQSAASDHAETIRAVLSANRMEVALNHPYPGDHILKMHGDPAHNIHAIQIEVDRSLYLDELLREPSHGLSAIGAIINEIVFALAQTAQWPMAEAAE
jgi:N-formylglutamate amidohydrolase